MLFRRVREKSGVDVTYDENDYTSSDMKNKS
jgi:hypothetical protein